MVENVKPMRDSKAVRKSESSRAGLQASAEMLFSSSQPATVRMRMTQSSHVVRLQLITILWMLFECGLALAAAWRARSPVLLAFGSDSLVELLSAGVVLLQFLPRLRLNATRAAWWAGVLLLLLAGLVTATSVAALALGIRPATSWLGIAVTLAALIIMPLLSRAKRTTAYAINNVALAADAVQSATCAYLAAISLAGLAANALFGLHWIDPLAALIAVPFVCIEAKRALRGEPCQCC
jgi:divalent metal cation (Fe/Co/Zn/Cd) transporter